MAIGTTAAILGGVGLASSAVQTVDGINQKNAAKNALDSLQPPESVNPYENMRVSTAGSDLLREEGQRRTANILDSLNGGGARSVMSALPRLVAMNNEINQKAKLDIDNQMLEREKLIAGYEEKRNQYDENRYQNELAGIGNMYNMGEHQMWNGIKGGITSLGTLGRGMQGGSGDNGFKSGMFSSGGSSDYSPWSMPNLSF